MFEDPKSTATKGIEKFLNDRIKKFNIILLTSTEQHQLVNEYFHSYQMQLQKIYQIRDSSSEHVIL